MRSQFKIIKNMGVAWTLFRAKYELKKKIGFLHKKFTPITITDTSFFQLLENERIIDEDTLLEYLKNHTDNFFFDANELSKISKGLNSILSDKSKEKALSDANDIIDNVVPYFNNEKVKYSKIDWHYSPFTKRKSPIHKHWLDISDLNSDFGDIKFIWELSRFSFVYDLVRAYVMTNDSKYAEKYWELIEDWIENNPLEHGVNYKCGQEMSFRTMAWLFGLYGFLNYKGTTPKRVTKLLKAVYQHMDHVEKNFEFALKAVKNNHTISEAAGMYTVGLLFPFMDKARKWKEKGKKYLEKEAQWQIYEDGSYIQDSMNYHRLMLQDYTWVIRLGEINKDYFTNTLKKKLEKAILFLYQHQIDSNGKVPNYGANDGALIHPLSMNDYLDYRPQLNAASVLLTGTRIYKNGDYDENLLWLFGYESIDKEFGIIKKVAMEYPNGGYYTFRGYNSLGMTRCTTFKHRPGQADMLHFDLWIDGLNVLTDAGSYSYNTNAKHKKYFNGTASHNTVMVNEKDQMQQGARFMRLNWTESKLLKYNTGSTCTIFEGEHYAYSPLIHRRGILNNKGNYIIVDDIFGDFNNKKNELQLSWLFGIDSLKKLSFKEWIFDVNNKEYKMTILSTNHFESIIYNGSEEPFRGWQSLYYGKKQAKPQLVIESNSQYKTRFITVITTVDTEVKYKDSSVMFGGEVFHLLPIGEKGIFVNSN